MLNQHYLMYIWEPVPICTPSGVDLTPGNVLYTNEAERGGFCAKESFLEFVTIACCKGMDQCSQILMQNRLLFSFALSNALYLSYYLSHVRMIRQKRWLHRLPVNYNSRIILLNRFDSRAKWFAKRLYKMHDAIVKMLEMIQDFNGQYSY